MGERGPKGKPTALRVLHGDKKNRINTDEPTAPEGLPEAPEMSDAVHDVWVYTMRQLDVMHCVSLADRDALVCYCEAVVMHRRASERLASDGLVVETTRGGLMRNPVIQVQRDAAATIRTFAREFGLTPSGRSDIRMGGKAKPDGADPGRLLS